MPQTPRMQEVWLLRNTAASTIALTTSPVILTSGAALGSLAALTGSDTLTTAEGASAYTAASGEYRLQTTGRAIQAFLRLKASKSAAGESVTLRLVSGASGDAAGVGAVIWQHTALLAVADGTAVQQIAVPILTTIPPSQGAVLTLQALSSGATNLVIAAADDFLFRAEVQQHRAGYSV